MFIERKKKVCLITSIDILSEASFFRSTGVVELKLLFSKWRKTDAQTKQSF